MGRTRKRLTPETATKLGFKPKPKTIHGNGEYYLTDEQLNKLSVLSDTNPNDYTEPLVLSAWNSKGFMMNIDEYCDVYKLPKQDITSYKLVSHTGTPFYNIVFKEKINDSVLDIDFKKIIKKHIKKITVQKVDVKNEYDFDMVTYSDTHIGMDTNKYGNSMYADEWNAKEAIKVSNEIVFNLLINKKSSILYVDDLGDLLDGFNGLTTRGGHDLPQNMTNEEVFDCGLSFKMNLVDKLASHYNKIVFNNICNDNHSGSFGYFVNKAFKELAEHKYKNITVNNHRTFLSHYFVKDICFIISHGKDDKMLKFGFKPHLDTKQIEKIDQYLKRNGIYSKAKRIIFKKGDSHQALFDMCGSDDFDYYNYPACSPSSQWVQNNFKKGRRGFIIENFKGLTNTITPILK